MTSGARTGIGMVPVAAQPAAGGQTTCANCGAELAPDQRYCLTCGEPVSPTRLAFLDVLLSAGGQAPATPLAGVQQRSGAQAGMSAGPLGRYAGPLSLLAGLLLAFVAGLLIGHWVTSSGRPVKELIKVQGASAAPTTTTPPKAGGSSKSANTTTTTTTTSAETPATSTPTNPTKLSKQTQENLEHSTGKKYEEEINKAISSGQPIETG